MAISSPSTMNAHAPRCVTTSVLPSSSSTTSSRVLCWNSSDTGVPHRPLSVTSRRLGESGTPPHIDCHLSAPRSSCSSLVPATVPGKATTTESGIATISSITSSKEVLRSETVHVPFASRVAIQWMFS